MTIPNAPELLAACKAVLDELDPPNNDSERALIHTIRQCRTRRYGRKRTYCAMDRMQRPALCTLAETVCPWQFYQQP